ncbi:MAG: DUF2817 domain-containing protein [Bacteriovoracia bacterium]
MSLQELQDLDLLETKALAGVSFVTLGTIDSNGRSFPIKAVRVGSTDVTKPVLVLVGGIHGLERIGSQVIVAYLHTLLQQLSWDRDLAATLDDYRILLLPAMNPVGMARATRANHRGVDLMRNAPVEAVGEVTPLVSGHRISRKLPWFRGVPGVLEPENQLLVDYIKAQVFPSRFALVLDVHSGFGIKDQIWYPFARSKEIFPREAEVLRLKGLLDRTYPNHIYKVEAQSANYLTHGDIWDHLFLAHAEEMDQTQHVFLPLTLELGSWNWLRKNPLQIFTRTGLFHPVKEHRYARIMRRHLLLFDFLKRAVRNSESWR